MSDYLFDKEKYLKKDAITVEQLIKTLEAYSKKMKVMTTWESTLHALQKKNIKAWMRYPNPCKNYQS